MAYAPTSLLDRFWAKVDQSSNCWLWTGGQVGRGYGRIFLRKHPDGHSTFEYAHRVSWEIASGIQLGPDEQVLHSCDTPLCVRFDHLWRGSQEDNMRDCVAKGRKRGGARSGEANHLSRLTADQVRQVRSRNAATGERQAIARDLGVSLSCIDHVLDGRTWRSLDLE